MALSNEELEEILVTIRNYQKVSTMGSTADRIADRAEEYVLFELQRREHGLFTLAEAVASGRPFRRKGWVPGLYADDIYDSECGHCESEGPMRFSFVRVDIENAYAESEDVTATDYEIQQEGERE